MGTTLGQNIIKARVDRRMNQAALRKATGISQRYLSAIEHDQVRPSFHIVQDIAAALGVSLDALAGCKREESAHV